MVPRWAAFMGHLRDVFGRIVCSHFLREPQSGDNYGKSVSKFRNAEEQVEPGPDQFVMKHMPLVKAIAAGIRRNLPAHVDLEDLVQAGALGLLDAARKYDAGKKVLFETYAKYRIRGAILDSLRGADSGLARISGNGKRKWKPPRGRLPPNLDGCQLKSRLPRRWGSILSASERC